MSVSHVYQRYTLQRRQQHGRLLLALPLVGTGVLIAAAIAFIVHVLWPAWQNAPLGADAPALPVTVAGVAFNAPPAAIRLPIQRQAGAHERLDLAFLWPSLLPPDGRPLSNVPTRGVPKQQSFERIFVTLAAARDSLPPTERVKTIYPRYLQSEAIAGPDGLAMVAFRQGTPYQGEDLIYDSAAPENFLVRCTRNGAAGMLGMCLLIRRIGDADITVRFPRNWLRDWRPVAEGIERLIAKLHSTHE
jgi:hypothetical protein